MMRDCSQRDDDAVRTNNTTPAGDKKRVGATTHGESSPTTKTPDPTHDPDQAADSFLVGLASVSMTRREGLARLVVRVEDRRVSHTRLRHGAERGGRRGDVTTVTAVEAFDGTSEPVKGLVELELRT